MLIKLKITRFSTIKIQNFGRKLQFVPTKLIPFKVSNDNKARVALGLGCNNASVTCINASRLSLTVART